jgi:hypothetical protein
MIIGCAKRPGKRRGGKRLSPAPRRSGKRDVLAHDSFFVLSGIGTNRPARRRLACGRQVRRASTRRAPTVW